jgi:hypothetical protein
LTFPLLSALFSFRDTRDTWFRISVLSCLGKIETLLIEKSNKYTAVHERRFRRSSLNQLPALHIRLEQLEMAVAAGSPEQRQGASRAASIEFKEGDRVRVTAGSPEQRQGASRAASVEFKEGDRVRVTAGSPEQQQGTSTAATVGFREGDRVRIRNKLKRPANQPKQEPWDCQLAQCATITHIYKEQVLFITESGVKTRCNENNLELTADQQKYALQHPTRLLVTARQAPGNDRAETGVDKDKG